MHILFILISERNKKAANVIMMGSLFSIFFLLWLITWPTLSQEIEFRGEVVTTNTVAKLASQWRGESGI